MTDKEQIEELSKELIAELGRETVDKFIEDEQGNLKKIVTYSLAAIAENLYNKGYRKINDECFILTKENTPQLAEQIMTDPRVAAKLNEKMMAQAKTTAKEILQDLYDYCFNLSDPYGDCDESNGDITPDHLIWYAKQYGVEIEE